MEHTIEPDASHGLDLERPPLPFGARLIVCFLALDALQRAIEADVGLAHALARWRTCVAEVAGDLGRDRRSLPAALIERWARRLAALPPGDPAALDRLQAAERRDAGILARCEVAYTTARAVVAAPYEARFVERHWTALDAIGRQIAAAEAALPTLPP
jgi:hypothetical protein